MRARIAMLSLLIGILFGPLTLLAQQHAQVVFPDDAKFSELQSAFQEKTKITGSAWADEFQKRQPFGQVRSSTGVTGILFTEAFALVALVAGQVPYIVYGTIDIPQGAKLAGREFSGKYGIVVIANPFVAALLDIATGTIGVFVILPVSGTTPLFPIFPVMPFLGPVGIFQILFSLITIPTPAPPAPPAPQVPQGPAPTCPQDLPNKSEINAPMNAVAVIATISDTAKLFEIGVAPPALLTVQSFTQALQFSYTTALYRRIGIIIGPGSQQIPVTLDLPFALFVTAGQKAACLAATPKLINSVPTIVGTLSTN
ncbi:MAG: hypothetical protein NZ930_01035 [Candidatus Bipolaricaulota bacterium]|nr:hypothetical protein [Candidatus Bipolaricaulota bacterium]MDW8031286.1 hypothetical protein [Candidatus Bipolaricaulota bacterium]